jgi:chromosome segregation ATPase
MPTEAEGVLLAVLRSVDSKITQLGETQSSVMAKLSAMATTMDHLRQKQDELSDRLDELSGRLEIVESAQADYLSSKRAIQGLASRLMAVIGILCTIIGAAYTLWRLAELIGGRL